MLPMWGKQQCYCFNLTYAILPRLNRLLGCTNRHKKFSDSSVHHKKFDVREPLLYSALHITQPR